MGGKEGEIPQGGAIGCVIGKSSRVSVPHLLASHQVGFDPLVDDLGRSRAKEYAPYSTHSKHC